MVATNGKHGKEKTVMAFWVIMGQLGGGLVWGYGYGYSVTDGVVITARLAKV